MAKIIVWSRRANNSFNSIIKYLESEWGEKVAKNFVVNAYRIIELLSEYPEMGTLEDNEKQIRGFVITKHNTLFYRIKTNNLILLNFFDTDSVPKKEPIFNSTNRLILLQLFRYEKITTLYRADRFWHKLPGPNYAIHETNL